MTEKKVAHKIFKTTLLPSDYDKFSELRRQCNSLSSQLYHDYISQIQSNLSENIKPFWNFINSKRANPSIPAQLTHNNIIADSPDDISNLFAKYFSSVYDQSPHLTHSSASNPPQSFPDYGINIGSCHISKTVVSVALNDLDPNKGMGPDNVPPILLKNCPSLVDPLTFLFNLSNVSFCVSKHRRIPLSLEIFIYYPHLQKR